VVRKQVLVTVLAGVIVAGSTAGAYAAISAGDEPVNSGNNTAVAPGFAGQQADLPTVTPQPGMINVQPIAWQQAEVLDSRTVRVLFSSGVEPCYVLDHITVDYTADEVVITLYQGTAPEAANTVCIQIAEEKATMVTLSEPIADRAIVDGSPRR